MTRNALADIRRLSARLISEIGVHPGAMMVSRADVVGIVTLALDHGAALINARVTDQRHCRVCGCTEFRACRPEPCSWAAGDLCTACEPFSEDIA